MRAEVDGSKTVIIVEDNQDDRFIVEESLEKLAHGLKLAFVKNGEALMDYLDERKNSHNGGSGQRPSLIFLDLNLPKKDGMEILKELKADPDFRKIPVIILTTSHAKDDIAKAYDLGANSYITKPQTLAELSFVFRNVFDYWFGTVRLPVDKQPV